MAAMRFETEGGSSLHQSIADKVFKIVVVGNMDVGKTSLITRYSENVFENEKIRTYGR